MSKPNTEFSEFDFHGSSDEEDTNSRGAFPNRSGIGIDSGAGLGVGVGVGDSSASGAVASSNGGVYAPVSEAGDISRLTPSQQSCGLSVAGGNSNSSHSVADTSKSGKGGSGCKKYRHQIYSKNIYIGTKNAEKWDLTRTRLAFKNDVEFVTYLLKLADNDTERSSSIPSSTNNFSNNFKLEPNLCAKNLPNGQLDHPDYPSIPPVKPGKSKKRVQFNDSINGQKKSEKPEYPLVNNLPADHIPEVLDCRIAEKIKSELEEKSAEGALCLKKTQEFEVFNRSEDEDDDEEDGEFRMRDRSSKFVNKAKFNGMYSAEGNGQHPLIKDEGEGDEDEDGYFDSMEDQKPPGIRLLQSCKECTVSHEFSECPFTSTDSCIPDRIGLAAWIERKNLENLEKLKAENNNDDDGDSSRSSDTEVKHASELLTFAEASLPGEFELRNLEPNTIGVFARMPIKKYCKLGPLIGQTVQSIDIPEDCNMRHIYEVHQNGRSEYVSAVNPSISNWLRYIRPAGSVEGSNVSLVCIQNRAFFVTSQEVQAGCELVYWSDDCNSLWRKQHDDRTNCGGCNVHFEHPLYYRTHCSVFHDASLSLTIRKYHCKVCGEAVIGKENIIKHAAEKHEGKGAYQCQFCNKFFLRLNCLEMHRTYGCSANPQRARPLCEFCGRKFCQPQKLKVHIKRMHSGSRAALQRHSKEVHSRNPAVVSCPRCQKLFQNRSNLKIHMLTHSGVRPFKCAEAECTAAFTTKQCLQFHYKKVHNYTQEQMPKIERSVAYTFDAYSGGMKVDYLEQAPRRRRKSLEDQNSLLSSSMLDSDMKSDTEFSEDNIFESIKKSGKSIKDLCRNETNLSLLSSKISSMFGKEVPRKRKRKQRPGTPKEGDESQDDHRLEQTRRKQNAQLSLVESFLSTTAQRLSQQVGVGDVGAGNGAEMPQDDNDNNFRHHGSQNSRDSINTIPPCQNLVVSKGSKKWISDDDRHLPRDDNPAKILPDPSKLLPNRDFIERFMMNNERPRDEDENSSFLDVVDSNNQVNQLPQFHHHQNEDDQPQMHMNPITHPQSFISSFYNNANARLSAGGAASTSASMLVEAALNSVGNMMDSESPQIKEPSANNLEGDNNLNADIEGNANRFPGSMNNIENLEHEIKMMKNLNNFPMQIPPLPMFQNAGNNLNSCNISPQTTANQPANSGGNTNDIDVDESSTPRGQHLNTDSDGFSNHHQTPPSPQVISPGRDYAMFNAGPNPANGTANISAASPLPSIHARRSAGGGYPEHELISPASSPAIPRYNFNNDLCRKREMDSERGQNISNQNQMSSDEEGSIIPQNSTNSGQDMRMKFTQSQMDLMYSKYESMSNAANLKYNSNQDLEVSDFRNNPGNDMSDMQGLDMSSRANVGSNYHHNFQLPSSGSNISGLGRYHHHIYDILSEREQQQQQQHSQQHNQQQEHQLAMQQHTPMHNMLSDPLAEQEHDQTTSVDLSRTANYVVSSPPPLPYSHSHHDMLRMVSLDLTPNTNMGVPNNRSFLSSQIQHNSRDTLDHHRLLSSAEQHRILAASNAADQHRLLVDPTAHLLMEQNNRLLEPTQNRHMARGFGAYHQVASGNYHPAVRPVLPSPNHHTPNPPNYHPFPAYY